MNCTSTLRLAAVVFLVLGSAATIAADDNAPSGTPTAPASTPTPAQALAELKQIGGVLVHFDDRKPDRPVIAVDFTNHPNFQEAWLKHLAAFPQLSTLGLAGIPLTDAGMRYLKRLTELETLTLTGTKITDEGLAELLKLKKLRHLDVRGTPVTGTGVTVLRRFLPALEIASGALSSDSSPPSAAESPLPKPPHEKPAILSVVEINELREKAAALSQPVEGQEEPQGWSKSRRRPRQARPDLRAPAAA